MAVGDETIGFGATVEVNDGGGSSFVAVGKVVSYDPPNYKVGTVESKRLDLDDRTIKFLATLKSGEPTTITVQNTQEGYERFVALRDSFSEDTQYRFTIQTDDADIEITVPAITTDVKLKTITADAIVEFDVMLQPSGAQL